MTDVDPDELAHAAEVKAMYVLHRDVGRAAMTKALEAINLMEPADIPIAVAVQLLKFGADLERKAVLGIEPDGDDDPFSRLAGALER
jgi:hypothetical protein